MRKKTKIYYYKYDDEITIDRSNVFLSLHSMETHTVESFSIFILASASIIIFIFIIMLQVCCTYSLAPQRLTLNLLRVRYLIGNYKNLVFDRQLQKFVCHNTTNKRSVQHFHPLSWVFLFTHYWHCTLFIAKPRWLLTVLNVVLIRYECWSVLLYQKLVGEAS